MKSQEKIVSNPAELFDSRQFGFSQIVTSKPGKHVFISGQVAWDNELNLVGKNDLSMQTEKSLENIKKAIKSAGGELEDIVMLRIYIVDSVEEYSIIISDRLKEYFGESNPPCSTWLRVSGLANEGFLIEIEAQAVI